MSHQTPSLIQMILFCGIAALQNSFLHAQPDRRVIMVIIDGARYSESLGDPMGTFVPRMKALAGRGVVVDSMMNDSITVTKRAIPAIWCGSWSIPKDTNVKGYANQYATVPTVWEYFRKARGVDSTHAMYIMKLLDSPWIQSYFPGYGPAYWPWYDLKGSTDTQVWQNALSKLQTYHPELAIIYLPDVDAAPSRGWAAYTQALVTADSIVSALWDFLQHDPVYRNVTTLLVTNDHGRHLDGVSNGFISHGDGCWGCRRIMLLAVGAGVAQGKLTAIRRRIPDIAPTIGALLQFSTPYATGSVMNEILAPPSAADGSSGIPAVFELDQNYPNPFNPTTVISYQLPVNGPVSLKVYNLLGKAVATLVDESKEAGAYDVQFSSTGMASGVYFYRLVAGRYSSIKKLVLLR